MQELLDLKPINFRLGSPAFVRIHGKGRKERLCPLLPQTAHIVERFLAEEGRIFEDRTPLFINRSGQKLSRHGVRYVFKKILGHCATKNARHELSRYQPSLAATC